MGGEFFRKRGDNMRFDMVIKGREYATPDGAYKIIKEWRKERKRISEYSDKEKWVWETYWCVKSVAIPTAERFIYKSHLLSDAKAFVERKYTEELGKLRSEFDLSDESPEMKAKGERIVELRAVLGGISKPRECRRPPRVVNR